MDEIKKFLSRLDRMLNSLEFVLFDLKEIGKLRKELAERYPPEGSRINDGLYLLTAALHILAFSQLEYTLKLLGKINKQADIKKVIEENKLLKESEKKNLLYLFYARHAVIHNGGHPDEKFRKNIKKLGITTEYSKNELVPIPADSPIYKLIIEFILLNITDKLLNVTKQLLEIKEK